jgi:hypothetical protein
MSNAPDSSSRISASSELTSSWGNDPLNYLVRVFVAFLQTVWETAPKGSFHWTPLSEETELVITEENPVHVETMEKRPALAVALGPTRFNGSSLDDRVMVNVRNAAEKHTDLLPTNITINCLSRVQSEARFLAWQNARMIWSLRKLFIAEKGIQECGRKNEIGSVTPAGALVTGDTEAEWVVCPVTVPVYLQYTDLVTPLKNEFDGHPIYTLQHISTVFKSRAEEIRSKMHLPETQDQVPVMRDRGLDTMRGGPRQPLRGQSIQEHKI